MKRAKFLTFVLSMLLLIPLTIRGQESSGAELFTNTYVVPPTFLSGNAGRVDIAPTDPFADVAPPPKGLKRPRNAKEVLESAGIIFGPGTTAMSGGSSQLIVRNTKAELEKVDAYFEALYRTNMPKSVHIFVEYIEVPGALYHNWMFENRIKRDGTELRKQAQKWVTAGDGTLLEISAIQARSGQRAKAESVSEKIYPTEMDPPEIPNKLLLEGKNTKSPVSAGTSTAFETRNVGATLEVDPVLGADNVTIDLNFSPEIVVQNGFTHWPPEDGGPMFTNSLPRFYTMKVTTQVTTVSGRYQLIGTAKPLKAAVEGRKRPVVLIFARADVGNSIPPSK